MKVDIILYKKGDDLLKWLKYYREKSGLSMSKLSEMIGVKLNTIWRWENEKASPSVDTAKILAKIFCITESELLNGPSRENWELKILMKKEGVIDMTEKKSSAVLNIGDEAMAITLEVCARDV